MTQAPSDKPNSNKDLVPETRIGPSRLPALDPAVPKHSEAGRSWLAFLLPVILLLAVLGVSPNFRWLEARSDELPFRQDPYGGDFLQEWAGGKIASIPVERKLLYSTGYANQIQHGDIVGFTWPAEKYYPMVYPPYYYWLVSPFSYLPYRWSAIVWTALSTVFFALAGWILYRCHSPLRNHAWPLMLAMTAFSPWIIALNMGQKSPFLLLLFVGTYCLFAQGQKFLAGMVFGLVAIKPQLGIVIGLAMLLNPKSWSFVAGATTTILGLLVLAQCLDDVWLGHFLDVVRGMGDYTSTGGYLLHDSHSLVASLKSALPSWLDDWGNSLAVVIGFAITILVSWVASFDSNQKSRAELNALQFANLVFATVLISPHLYTYDLTILLLPIVLVVTTIARSSLKIEDPLKVGGLETLGQTTQWGTCTRGLVILLFIVAGILPKLNNATGIPWGTLLILAIILTLSLHLWHSRLERKIGSEKIRAA